MLRIYLAMLNSLRGLRDAARSEAAVRQELALIAVGLPLGLLVAPDAGWYVAMAAALLLTLAVELLNTAIEKLADHVSPEWRRNIGMIKDFGSAAVMCMLVLATLVWATALALRLGWL